MSESEAGRTMRYAGREARETIDQAANAADNMTQRVSEAASDAGATVRDATRKVSAAAADVGGQVLERGQRVGKGVAEQVANQPITSVMLAAAAGLFVGLLLSRR